MRDRLPPLDVARPPEIGIAGYRVMLGVLAFFATWIDPKIGGRFHLDESSVVSLAIYLTYAVAVWVALFRGWISAHAELNLTTFADVGLGLLIAAVTPRAASPYAVFLAFGVLAAGARGNSVKCLAVTAASILGYVVLAWAKVGSDFSLMRPVYLGIMGLMLAAIGKSYSDYFSATARNLAALEERNRIARTLHDGCLQTIAGTTLQVEAVRQALEQGLGSRAEALLRELRSGLDREHDGLRAYVRDLAGVPDRSPPRPTVAGPEPRVHVDVDVATTLAGLEWMGTIVREGLSNVRRHANATEARVRLRATEEEIRLTLADDGVGFPAGGPLPWSIESRVLEAGGTIELDRNDEPGTRLVIKLPVPRA